MNSDLIILTQTDNPIPAPARRVAAIARFMGLEPAIIPIVRALQSEGSIPAGTPLMMSADALVTAERGDVATVDALLFGNQRQALVYGFCESARHNKLVGRLTDGALTAVVSLSQADRTYKVDAASAALTGPFAGITFGPVTPSIDRVFLPESKATPMEHHITIAGHPLFVSCQRSAATVFLTACAQVADIETPAAAPPLPKRLFSSLMPIMMFLRHACGPRCWRPSGHWACLIVDDPILRPRYGFLDFAQLLRQMDAHNFAAAIAMIPANHRRTRQSTATLFVQHPERLSIVAHGCDHRRHEFATPDSARLNAMVTRGTCCLASHEARRGVRCEPVMVFPHGSFSAEAMQALKHHGFLGAVASVDALAEATHPAVKDADPPLLIADFLAPAITAFAGFPLYPRRYPRDLAEFAFDLFLGKPALIAAHHEYFRDGGDAAANFADRLTALAPELRWCSPATGMRETCFHRRDAAGRLHIRALAHEQHLQGALASEPTCVIMPTTPCPAVTRVTLNGRDCRFQDAAGLLTVDLPGDPQGEAWLRIVQEDDAGLARHRRSIRGAFAAYVRRRLTDFRDNHVMPNRALAWLADLWKWLDTRGRPRPPVRQPHS